MNTAVATLKPAGQSLAVAEHEAAVRTALKTSLYPGAADASVDLVLAYCKAAGLDPMQKPVHIVPMWDSKSGQMRDVVMPGIGLYRVQAARSGDWAGVSEPEFGPMQTEKIGGVDITYPEWCRVTTRRLMRDGKIAEFTSVEYWIENYAVKGGKEKSIAPNAMWQKRPRGQIAKCAQAQSLRLAFPEIGSQPTAEEMEGKTIDAEATVIQSDRVAMPQAKQLPVEQANPATGVDAPAAGEAGIHDLSAGQVKLLKAKATGAGFIDDAGDFDEDALLEKFPSIGPTNINDVLASLRTIAEERDAA